VNEAAQDGPQETKENDIMARTNNGRTQSRTQDRTERDTDRGEERGGKPYKEIFGVVDRGENSFWTRIGVAFVNADSSLNLLFNFVPTDPQTTIQIRDPRPREE
jgi:hypothetical protein